MPAMVSGKRRRSVGVTSDDDADCVGTTSIVDESSDAELQEAEIVSTPLTPPAFDVLQRVTKASVAGYTGTVCELVPASNDRGQFHQWLYRVAWDNEFAGPALTPAQLDDAQWLSSNCKRPEEVPAGDLRLLPVSRTRGVRRPLPPGVF